MSVVNNRFPAWSIPYIHLHTAAPPLQGPARTPPPRDGRGQGVIYHIGTLFPLWREQCSPALTHQDSVNLHLRGPLSVCWDTPAAHTDLHQALLNNPPLGSHHILPSGILLVYLYMTPELFKLLVNLHFTSLLGFLGKLHLK